MSTDKRMKAVQPYPNVCLLACTICGVLVWDFDAHYAHAHQDCGHPNHGANDHDCTPFLVAASQNREEQNR